MNRKYKCRMDSMAIKFDVEDDLTYRVDISVIAFGKEAINGVNNLLDNKINYFNFSFTISIIAALNLADSLVRSFIQPLQKNIFSCKPPARGGD